MTEPLYECDYEKNVECKKTACLYLGRGECFCTLDKSYAKCKDNLADMELYERVRRKILRKSGMEEM